MTAVNRATLYTYFLTGDKPTQAQFANLIDSNLNLATTSAQAITADVSALGKLDVTGNLTVKGSALTTLTGNLVVGGTLSVSAAQTFPSLVITNTLAVSGTTTLSSTFNVTGSSQSTLSGNTVINGSLSVSAASTFAAVSASTVTVNAGASTGTLLASGRINSQYSATGIGNGADTTDDTLFTYTLPANALNTTGQAIRVTAWGGFAANGNNKRVIINFGTYQISTGTITDNAKGWKAQMIVGRNGASSQVISGEILHDTTWITEAFSTQTITDTAPIVIKITGASQTSGTANDVVAYGFLVEFLC